MAEFKFLAIKNWDKYQSAKKSCTWIKDYVEKDFDPEFSKLTVFQRGLLDMCCRLRGRQAKNLSNDPLWIVRAVSILPQERRNAISAISQLIVKGFLVLTNQQHDSLDKEKEEIRIEKEEIREREKVPDTKLHDSLFAKCYESYPRHVAVRDAEKCFKPAVERVAAKNKSSPDEAAGFIYQRIMQFSALCRRANKDKKYIPHMATWLNKDRFFDDPTEWEVQDRNGKQTKLDRNLQSFAELEFEERSEAAGAGNSQALSGAGNPQGKHSGHH